jgi:hypothetical protein
LKEVMVNGWLPYMYPGIRAEKVRKWRGGLIIAAAKTYLVVFVPPLALEVTRNLDKEENSDGRSNIDLGTGLKGYIGGIDKRPREDVFPLAFPLLSPA